MRTTVMIDDDVYVKVRQMAEDSGRTLGQVISQLARKGLFCMNRYLKRKCPSFEC